MLNTRIAPNCCHSTSSLFFPSLLPSFSRPLNHSLSCI